MISRPANSAEIEGSIKLCISTRHKVHIISGRSSRQWRTSRQHGSVSYSCFSADAALLCTSLMYAFSAPKLGKDMHGFFGCYRVDH
jgi:hypothetical protein